MGEEGAKEGTQHSWECASRSLIYTLPPPPWLGEQALELPLWCSWIMAGIPLLRHPSTIKLLSVGHLVPRVRPEGSVVAVAICPFSASPLKWLAEILLCWGCASQISQLSSALWSPAQHQFSFIATESPRSQGIAQVHRCAALAASCCISLDSCDRPPWEV